VKPLGEFKITVLKKQKGPQLRGEIAVGKGRGMHTGLVGEIRHPTKTRLVIYYRKGRKTLEKSKEQKVKNSGYQNAKSTGGLNLAVGRATLEQLESHSRAKQEKKA